MFIVVPHGPTKSSPPSHLCPCPCTCPCPNQVQAIFKIASSQELPAIPETLSPEASEFILLCLQRDPAARPSADELLKHPFVSDVPGNVPALFGTDGGGGYRANHQSRQVCVLRWTLHPLEAHSLGHSHPIAHPPAHNLSTHLPTLPMHLLLM